VEYLLGLLVALFLITLVGHGIWVVLAKLFQMLSGALPAEKDPSSARQFQERCLNCAEPLRPAYSLCPRCGLTPGVARRMADLNATVRSLQEFHREGLLDAAQFQRFCNHVEELHRVATARRSPAEPKELPVAQPPPVRTADRTAERPPATARKQAIFEALPVEDSPVPKMAVQEALPRKKAARPPKPAPPPMPRRTLAEWLAAFMEERNILWGELIGGLLMVGCSIALVISLWSKLAEIPYFPFLILAALTAAVFGLGLYTFHRWKLPSTSRGLLVIATLLVPLNFVVLAGLSQGAAGGPLEIATKVLGVVGFAWLVHRAGGVLLPVEEATERRNWFSAGLLLPLAVVGTPISQLSLVRCIDPPDLGPWFVPLAAWPVVLYALGVGGFLVRQLNRRPAEESGTLLGFLGLSTFSLLLSLGFIGFWAVARGCPRAEVLERLAILIALAGIPSLAVGLFIRRSKAGAEPGSTASHLLMGGTGVALGGMLVMLGAVVVAWPNPTMLLAVCLVNFAVFTGVAFVFRLPVAHAAALVCLTVGYLTGYHMGAGDLAGRAREDWAGRLTELAYSGPSGAALLLLFAVMVAAAEGLGAKGRAADSFFYRVGACVVAFISLVIAGRWGMVEPARATIIYGVAAASGLILSRRWRCAWLDQAGAVLILATTLWGLHWGCPGAYPLWGCVLAAEALVLSVVAGRWWPQVLAAAGLALVTAFLKPDQGESAWHSLNLFALAATAFVQAWRRRWEGLSWLGSGLVLAGIVHLLIPRFPEVGPPLGILASLLIHATSMQLTALFIRWRWPRGVAHFAIPLGQSTLVPLVLALPMMLVQIEPGELQQRALYATWLAALWLAQTLVERRRFLFPVFQATLSGAVLFGVASILVRQKWVVDDYPRGLLDVRSLQIFGLALAALSLCWGVLRLALRAKTVAQELLETVTPSVDRLILGALVVGQALLAALVVTPGVVRESAPQTWDFGGWPIWTTAVLHLSGLAGWLLLTWLGLTLTVWLWEARTALRQTAVVLGLLLLAVSAPLLAAGRFADETAVASALRWGLAGSFLAISVPLWVRNELARPISRVGIYADAPDCAWLTRRALIAATALPVVGLSVGMALVVLAGGKPSGPGAGSVFARMGSLGSHLIPLSFVLVGLTGHALRERSQANAFAGGLVALLVIVGGYALQVVQGGGALGFTEGVILLQLGTITLAAWALGWLGILRFGSGWLRAADAPLRSLLPAGSLLRVQVLLGVFGSALLVALALPHLVSAPEQIAFGSSALERLLPFGHVLGWAAWGVSLAAVLVYGRRCAPSWEPHAGCAALLAGGVLAACTLAQWDDGNWLAYHALMLAWTLAAWGIGASGLFLGPTMPRWEERLLAWAQAAGALVVGLAVRAAWQDPARHFYLPSFAVLAIASLVGSLALRRRRLAEVVVAGCLLDLAGILAWIASGPNSLGSFIHVNVLCIALASVAWAIVEHARRVMNPGGESIATSARASDFSRLFRHGAAYAGAVALAILAGFGLLWLPDPSPLPATGSLAWCAWGAVVLALALSLWDAGARLALPALYSMGLTGLAMLLQGLEWPPSSLVRTALLMTAGYVLLTALLARLSERVNSWREVLRLPPRALPKSLGWFVPTQASVVGLVVLASAAVSLMDGSSLERFAGPLAVSLVMSAGVVLAWRPDGEPEEEIRGITLSWTRPMRVAVLVMGVLLLSEMDWALFHSTAPAVGLHRAVGVLMALAFTTVIYGFCLSRLLPSGNVWAADGRRIAPLLGLAASVAVAIVLALEGLTFDTTTKHTPLAQLEILGILLAQVGLMTAGIAFAVVPWADPFQLSERRRPYYVYASEMMLVFFILHLRLNVPELFVYFRGKYWTFFVMAVAFIGVGLSEFFQRRKLHVLASPLQRTGIFLPLLPLIGFWVRQPAELLHDRLVALIPGTAPLLDSLRNVDQRLDFYALLWFSFGALYAWLAITRRSYWFALGASLAANAGLWVLLGEHDIQFVAHPQLWLIPLALIVLVSEVINRPHLSRQLSTGLRYLGLGLLYISSTADFFIAGLGDVPLALVLALLSVLGVLAGIVFRVRSYLYLGVAFLVLVIFSMIWHAAVELAHVWVWWVSGIALGAAILGLFALFEKRRQDLLRVVDEFRSWR
jgi:hypothetical protein